VRVGVQAVLRQHRLQDELLPLLRTLNLLLQIAERLKGLIGDFGHGVLVTSRDDSVGGATGVYVFKVSLV